MPWPGALLGFVLIFTATDGPPGASAEGNVGCLFSKTLCLDGVEFCYDDFAFGRCLPESETNLEDELFRYNLDKETLHHFSRELERLFYLGYRWSHAYTQCRLQAMLYAIRTTLSFETNVCSHLIDQDLGGALQALEGEAVPDPQEVAIVKYTPSVENPHADFADEVYYPPTATGDRSYSSGRDVIFPQYAVELPDMEDPYLDHRLKKRTWVPMLNRQISDDGEERFDAPDFLGNDRNRLDFLPQMQENDLPPNSVINKYFQQQQQQQYNPFVNQMDNSYQFNHDLLGQFAMPLGRHDADVLGKINREEEQEFFGEQLMNRGDKIQQLPGVFSLSYNTPDNFRAGFESKDFSIADKYPESRIYFDENDNGEAHPREYGSGLEMTPDGFVGEFSESEVGLQPPSRNDEMTHHAENYGVERKIKNGPNVFADSGVYTEGGVVYVSNPEISADGVGTSSLLRENFLDNILKKLNLGFKRPERLDVKKPGPQFLAINKKLEVNDEDSTVEDTIVPNMMKKEPRGAHPNPLHEIYDIETDYVYVVFNNRIKTWGEGRAIIANITSILNLPLDSITTGRVEQNEVTFKVGPKAGLNASEVAHRIDMKQQELNTLTGLQVIAAGVGDTTRKQSVMKSPIVLTDDNWFTMILICGLLGSLIVAVGLLLIIKRYAISRDKLNGLPQRDNEASKDYQDLCRARMATKNQVAGETVHGRITSLSRESEQSPSSRSSTSSWSEEPALHNMDISTGHMVLSYMEDHLRNKDRLEQEWVALCAYVAEPSETTIATKKENVEKNRYPDVMPYDHSRVILNELSNVDGSDYINASSITDHDPRNPAYIATQGSLPHTAPDFWQMIWEQGAVVIVMLTRLTEGGAAMCHRYWPEEGSELYNIYEVHLVSEHIWCDDYLVRSFYLKNTRTGETRTVTQFHFLSWPEASVPASTKALLEFRRKVNKSYRGRSCPIVVHCSDGAGRTGTYCLIDMVLSRMAKGAKEIDIAATLEHLRDQRPRMVATKHQFEFVLTAVAEEVHAILKGLPPQVNPGQQQQQQQEK